MPVFEEDNSSLSENASTGNFTEESNDRAAKKREDRQRKRQLDREKKEA